MNSSNSSRVEWHSRFVTEVCRRCSQDKGLAAGLRRADNPATEYLSWEVLASLGVNLEKEYERIPFVTVAAQIAKSKATANGTQGLGRALAACYEQGQDNAQAKARLRRLLACSDIAEVCRVLRPLFSLITSRKSSSIDYVRLLGQLRNFYFNDQGVKAQWAQEFYSSGKAEKTA